MNWKAISYSLRALYLLLIAAAALSGEYGTALFNGVIFIVTLLVQYLARRDKDYYPLDSALMVLFSIPLAATFFGYVMRSSLLGEDKLFHVAGGALLAWFALITFRKHIRPGLAYALAIVCFAVAVGAWWEIYEWVMLLLKNGEMRISLSDTMLDIVADTLGAILVAAIYWKRK